MPSKTNEPIINHLKMYPKVSSILHGPIDAIKDDFKLLNLLDRKCYVPFSVSDKSGLGFLGLEGGVREC